MDKFKTSRRSFIKSSAAILATTAVGGGGAMDLVVRLTGSGRGGVVWITDECHIIKAITHEIYRPALVNRFWNI